MDSMTVKCPNLSSKKLTVETKIFWREFQFAIQQIQKSANIVESGVLNPKTIEVLSAGRCGNPDGDFESNEIKFITSPKTLVKKNGSGEEIAEGKSRGKRFAVGGNRWDTHRLSFEVRNGPFTLSQGQVRRAFRKALGKAELILIEYFDNFRTLFLL